MNKGLIAYRQSPAELLAEVGNKFEICYQGKTLKVRAKDFIFLHPEYQNIKQKSIRHLTISDEILTTLGGQEFSIKDLSLWLYDAYTPQFAWQVYQIGQQRIYAYQRRDKIVVRTSNQAHKILTEIVTEQQETEKRSACVARLKQGSFISDDVPYLTEIAKLALGMSKHSPTLKQLGRENTPEVAHQLLLDINYWQAGFNPYPQRLKYPHTKDININQATKINRTDLTHLNSYAIDNITSSDADDALSVDGNRCWVHIADVFAWIKTNTAIYEHALSAPTSLYLPDQTISMLPKSLEQKASLGALSPSKALSIGVVITGGEITDIEICHSNINASNLYYSQINLNDNTDLERLAKLAREHYLWRKSCGAVQLNLPKININYANNNISFSNDNFSQSRQMVAEWMIIAGRAIAILAKNNQIPMPFLSQEDANINFSNKHKTLTLAQKFDILKKLKRSKIQTQPHHHSSLGLDAYVRFSSPIRRYLDLLAHEQIHRFLAGDTLLSEVELKYRIKQINTKLPLANRLLKNSQQHYLCLYFSQNLDWHGSATIINYQRQIANIFIDKINILTEIISEKPLKKNHKVKIAIASADIAKLQLNFKLI